MIKRRRYIFASVSDEEYARVKALADGERVSIANLIRQCVNDRFTEDDAADVVLREPVWGRPCRS